MTGQFFCEVECPEPVEGQGMQRSGHTFMAELFPTLVPPERISGFAWVYILQSIDSSLYIGQTRDLIERLRKHRFGLGSKHTHDHALLRLVFFEGPLASGAAIAREKQLKGWSRTKKEALIAGDLEKLRRLSRSRGLHM